MICVRQKQILKAFSLSKELRALPYRFCLYKEADNQYDEIAIMALLAMVNRFRPTNSGVLGRFPVVRAWLLTKPSGLPPLGLSWHVCALGIPTHDKPRGSIP